MLSKLCSKFVSEKRIPSLTLYVLSKELDCFENFVLVKFVLTKELMYM